MELLEEAFDVLEAVISMELFPTVFGVDEVQEYLRIIMYLPVKHVSL